MLVAIEIRAAAIFFVGYGKEERFGAEGTNNAGYRSLTRPDGDAKEDKARQLQRSA
jgi:hypothetical protein